MVQLLWKTIWHILIKLNIPLPYDPVIPLLSRFPREMETYVHTKDFFFFYGCVGSSFLHEGSLQLWQAGATLHRGALASHCCGPSCRGAQAPDAQAQ